MVHCDEGEAFDGACYVLHEDPQGFEGAAEACITSGGHLLTLNSIEELRFLQSTIFSPFTNALTMTWLGAVATADRTMYLWDDGTGW